MPRIRARSPRDKKFPCKALTTLATTRAADRTWRSRAGHLPNRAGPPGAPAHELRRHLPRRQRSTNGRDRRRRSQVGGEDGMTTTFD
jgi:hypothetical protein